MKADFYFLEFTSIWGARNRRCWKLRSARYHQQPITALTQPKTQFKNFPISNFLLYLQNAAAVDVDGCHWELADLIFGKCCLVWDIMQVKIRNQRIKWYFHFPKFTSIWSARNWRCWKLRSARSHQQPITALTQLKTQFQNFPIFQFPAFSPERGRCRYWWLVLGTCRSDFLESADWFGI